MRRVPALGDSAGGGGGDDEPLEAKFNPNQDSAGRFTFAAGAGAGGAGPLARPSGTPPRPLRYYTGMTANGVSRITPTSGGYVDVSGRYIPEMFPPDPYRLNDPGSALAHYMGGSGEDRNYYLNSVDTSALKVSDFPAMKRVLDAGKPGTYGFADTSAEKFDAGQPPRRDKFSAANTVGRLALQANGSLVIASDGRYAFSGVLGVQRETYQFYSSAKRTPDAEAKTKLGMLLPGKSFPVHVVGTKPFVTTGHTPIKRTK